jgi:hypothetical protein
MATSGIVTFRQNRDQLITDALLLVGAIDPENPTPTPNQISQGANHLNRMLKSWQTIGLELWERKYGVVFMQKNQGIYVFGNPGPAGDHATKANNLNEGSFLQTTLSVTALATATTITLTTITNVGTVGIPNFNVSDTFNIGVELDTGFIQWFTVSGAPAGNVVTLSASLPSQATLGNTVYCYQTKLVKPLRVLNAFFRQPQGNDIPVRLISRDEFDRFGVKTSTGTPIQLFYNPEENQGILEIYPQPTDVDGQLYIEFQNPTEDFVTSTDDFDLPSEWGEAIVWNLARRLIPSYRVPVATAADIRAFAKDSYENLKAWDQETNSIFITPEEWMYQFPYGGR